MVHLPCEITTKKQLLLCEMEKRSLKKFREKKRSPHSIQEEVLWLSVPVGHLAGVHIMERLDELCRVEIGPGTNTSELM